MWQTRKNHQVLCCLKIIFIFYAFKLVQIHANWKQTTLLAGFLTVTQYSLKASYITFREMASDRSTFSRWLDLVLVVLQWPLYISQGTVGWFCSWMLTYNVPTGEEASDARQFPYIHLSTFIIQEYKTTQSNLSSYKDSLPHPSAACHIKDSSPSFREQCLEDDTQYVCTDCP